MSLVRFVLSSIVRLVLAVGGLCAVVYSASALIRSAGEAANLLRGHKQLPLLYWIENFGLNLCMLALGLWLLSFVARGFVADLRAHPIRHLNRP